MLPRGLLPMLASPGPLPLGAGWAYEVKWDGIRALVAVEGGQVRATSRSGNDVTGGYPELSALGLPEGVLLDGELVVLGAGGVPDFGLLQSRMHVRGPGPALRERAPVSFLPFDLLYVDGTPLLAAPYDERRAALDALDLDAPPVFLEGGADLLASTLDSGLEGVVAKRRDGRYLPGRRTDGWVKVKHVRRQSAVICGWKPGTGGRAGAVGSLLLGIHAGADPAGAGLRYVGHVGTGFDAAALTLLADRLAPLARATAPYDGPVPREHARLARWVEPVLVCDVALTAWTREGRLRHPSYKGLRDDLDPTTVVRDA